MDLATQVDELRAGGSRVEVVFPDGRAGDVFNANALDPATRLPAAKGGYEQGRALGTLGFLGLTREGPVVIDGAFSTKLLRRWPTGPGLRPRAPRAPPRGTPGAP